MEPLNEVVKLKVMFIPCITFGVDDASCLVFKSPSHSVLINRYWGYVYQNDISVQPMPGQQFTA